MRVRSMTGARLLFWSFGVTLLLLQSKVSPAAASPDDCWDCVSPEYTSCQYCSGSNDTLNGTCNSGYRLSEHGTPGEGDEETRSAAEGPEVCLGTTNASRAVNVSAGWMCCRKGNVDDMSVFIMSLGIAILLVGLLLLAIIAATIYYCLRRRGLVGQCTCKARCTYCKTKDQQGKLRLSDIEEIQPVKGPPSPKIVPIMFYWSHGAQSMIGESGEIAKKRKSKRVLMAGRAVDLPPSTIEERLDSPISPEPPGSPITIEADIGTNPAFEMDEGVQRNDVGAAREEEGRLGDYLSAARQLGEAALCRGTWNDALFANPVFAAGLFDVEGGHLALEDMGIDLFIPPGAITEGDEPTFVYLYISRDPNHSPSVSERRVSVSGVVHCGPSGLRFRERVVLSYQHCADMESQGVRVIALSSESDPGDAAEYRNLMDDETSMSIVKDNKCLLYVTHFTGFTSVAEATPIQAVDEQVGTPVIKKLVEILGFHGDLNPGIKKLPLRLYCVNKTDDAKQLVLEEEYRMSGHQADAPKTMSFLNNQRDLEVHMNEIDPTWKIGGTGPIQSIDYEVVMSSSFSACSYSMSKQDKTANTFDCVVNAFQRDNAKYDENNKQPVYFTINESKPPAAQDIDARYKVKESRRNNPRLKYSDRLKLSLLLDPNSPLGNDWRMVADKMSLGYDTIQQIEEQFLAGIVPSPTREVLNYWDATKKDAPLGDLVVIFEDIERLDAVEIVRNAMQSSSKDGQASR